VFRGCIEYYSDTVDSIWAFEVFIRSLEVFRCVYRVFKGEYRVLDVHIQ